MFSKPTLLVRKNWWKLPSFLGLDAPCVTVCWIWIFARFSQSEVAIENYAGAFLAVWSIYLADRIFDVKSCRDWRNSTDRMLFGKRFYRLFWILLVAVLVSGTALLVSGKLSPTVAKQALIVGAGVCGYFLVFVLPPVFRQKKWPGKEVGVGLFFAAGILTAIGFENVPVLEVVIFGCAVVFNCLLIAAKDHATDAVNDPGAASQWWPRIQGELFHAGWVLTLLTCGLCIFRIVNRAEFEILACLAIALFLMTILHQKASLFSPGGIRALADFCLLAPLVAVPLL